MLRIELPTRRSTMQWTGAWPTTPGVYWFYGYPWGKEKAARQGDKGPDLMCVNVVKILNGEHFRPSVLYVTEGFTISKDEGAIGLWTLCLLPDKPTEFNTRDGVPS